MPPQIKEVKYNLGGAGLPIISIKRWNREGWKGKKFLEVRFGSKN